MMFVPALFDLEKPVASGWPKWLSPIKCMAESKGPRRCFCQRLARHRRADLRGNSGDLGNPREAQPQHSRRGAVMKRDKGKRNHTHACSCSTPSGPLDEPGGRAWRSEPRVIATPMNRTVADRNQQHSGLADDGGVEKRDCSRMQDGDHIHRRGGEATGANKCLKGSHTST